MPDLVAASPRPAEHRLRGIALRIVTITCFTGLAVAIKLAAERGASGLELIFYRNLFSFPLILAWLAIGPGFASVRTNRPGAHATRAAIGLVSMVLNFHAVMMLPLAEATTIGFAAPLFATMLSAIVLGEAVGRHRWAAVLVGFIGVIAVMRPGSNVLPVDGLIVAVLSAIGVATVVVTIRQIGATEAASATVFWFNIASLAVMTPIMAFVGHWPDAELLALFVMVGVCGGLAQMTMTSSLRYAPVSVLAPFDYLQLLGAMLAGWLIWSASPSSATLAGAALIVGSGLYTAFREHRLHRDTSAATPPSI